jgi:acyl-CoA thioesterase-2
VDLATLLALEPYRSDTWIGTGPRYPWGGLYGGQIVAQGLRAAAATVEPGLVPHSLHASFLRSGSHTEKILFEVDRVRDGRSFTNRRVTATQPVGVILTMTASFQVREQGAEVQTVTFPRVPTPGELPSAGWSTAFERRFARPPVGGSALAWMRVGSPLGDDPVLQACALAYESDDLPTDAVVALHPERGTPEEFHGQLFTASLDHAIWFHRPLRADAWHLQAFECHGLSGSRGTALGHVFAADGTHTATIAQEIVVRRRDG